MQGSRGPDKLVGGVGDDVLSGDSGDDTLIGGPGNDRYTEFAGNDTYRYFVGDGDDVISDYNGADDAVKFGPGIAAADLTLSRYVNATLRIDLPGGSLRIDSQFDSKGGIEHFDFAGGETLDLTGTEFTTYGSAEGDRIYGIRYGGSTVDRIHAGGGDDEIYAQGANTYEYTANWLYGQAGNDSLNGGRGPDWIEGGWGNDALSGDSGDDTLIGGRGDDRIEDYAGNDTYRYARGDGNDVISDWRGDVDVLAFSAGIEPADLTLWRSLNATLMIDLPGGSLRIDSQFVNKGAIEQLTFADGAVLDLTTMAFTTFGSEAGERIYGIRYGGARVDRIHGGGGDDDIYAQPPNSYEYTENWLYGEAGDDSLNGGRGPDELFGGRGDDVLDGYLGDDLLDGGWGDDLLYGGRGQDVFVYSAGADRIADFDAEVLRLEDRLWGGSAKPVAEILALAQVIDGDTVFDFGGGATLTLTGWTDLAGLEALIEVV